MLTIPTESLKYCVDFTQSVMDHSPTVMAHVQKCQVFLGAGRSADVTGGRGMSLTPYRGVCPTCRHDHGDPLLKQIEAAGTSFAFGLRAQGHLPTIERMLADGKAWNDIGKEIGWHPETAQRFYAREVATPTAKESES